MAFILAYEETRIGVTGVYKIAIIKRAVLLWVSESMFMVTLANIINISTKLVQH